MSVVLITGCSSGLGKECALAFARNGDTVYASMRDLSKAAALQQAALAEGLVIRIILLDVTQPATFDSAVRSIVMEKGTLDVLVNNAGVLRTGAFEETDEATLREVMETNFFGPLLLSRSVVPQMRLQNGGYIIMISSLSGIAGLPGEFSYAASKFALEGATEALRHEVDRWGIKVALVEPGQHATHLFAASMSTNAKLPQADPAESPYRALLEYQLLKRRERLADSFDPRNLGELLVRIARSDGRQLRWPSDPVATKVLAELRTLDDRARDEYLRGISGTDWWSCGKLHPDR